MNPPPTSRDREAFYSAALIGLRALDARERTPRRFGPDADTNWKAFQGALGSGDRIDLLLRDAAVTWGAAFSPAEAFGFFGLAEDEPFGPDWEGLADERAERLLAESGSASSLIEAARALGVQPSPVQVPPLTPATRIAVAGGPPSSRSPIGSRRTPTSPGPIRWWPSPAPPSTVSSPPWSPPSSVLGVAPSSSSPPRTWPPRS